MKTLYQTVTNMTIIDKIEELIAEGKIKVDREGNLIEFYGGKREKDSR